MTKLLFIDNGIEFDSILLKKRPFGGAEVAFVSLVEALAKLNYEVLVYNNCINEGRINGVKWRKLDSRIFEEKFDVLIVNRGDKFLNFKKECKKRIFWIHNPAKYLLKYRYLSKLFFNKFKIVFSSNFHLSTYPWWAPASEKFIIPYGVNNETILQRNKAPKPISIFTSNPMRGLSWLLDQWEKNIFPNVKKARLNLFPRFKRYSSEEALKATKAYLEKRDVRPGDVTSATGATGVASATGSHLSVMTGITGPEIISEKKMEKMEAEKKAETGSAYHGFNHTVLKYKVTHHLEKHDERLKAQREGSAEE